MTNIKSTKQMAVDSLVSRRCSLSVFTVEMSKMNVRVVQPAQIVSANYLANESRFFPEVNEEDIVVGGRFA